MNANFAAKIARIQAIHFAIQELAEQRGVSIPRAQGTSRAEVRIDLPPLLVTSSPDRFRCMARRSETKIAECILPRPGWTLVDVILRGEKRLSFNIADDGTIDIYLFRPGGWMHEFFDVDPAGDHTPILPCLVEDDRDPEWTAFKASGLYEWPPRFAEPSSVD
ncbi:hypothetical protein [Aurantiacibacter hainanensis]|uniref:hypothetical protein n=1 Tax=Aurantiacibacter hainanensis TaxID=3076114 RepID=UPI0030C70308